ncbi:hypothetical protein IE81DRAFT_138465 [Ceraceosorus guamensis]|uniref:PEBP-like protein n=1 Tax=Ceraceosorus guamensis TaxID=1522189 RepID=A0A316W3Z5_9BASI|nr:hypothetical protein IE81DRAFT_138465 [Ceraceosorus guamensis]PWN42325.1 hypothetical protein IE81DRAFT_138465 [Ceraceosorus guamensis]
MFSRSITALALSLVPALVAAQKESVTEVATSIANTTLQMQAVGLIPDPVPTSALNLTAALGLRFGEGSRDIATGQTVSVDQAKGTPQYSIEYPESVADELDGATFTVLFLDAGAAGVGNPALLDGLLTRHFLGNNFKLGDDGRLTNSTPAITEYASPAPAAGSGPHRYFQVVALQPSNFQAPQNLSQPGTALSTMSLASYISESNLGKIVAASFVLIEDNSAEVTASVSSTAAVQSASVQALATSVSKSLASPSGAPSASGTGTSGNGAAYVAPTKALVASAAAVAAVAFGAALI